MHHAGRLGAARRAGLVQRQTLPGRGEGLLADGCRHRNLDPVLATARFAHLEQE